MPARKDRQRVPPRIAAEVMERWGNDCWLDMPGCARVSDTTDHIVPDRAGGPTIVSNLRRACKHCNSLRSDRTLNHYGASIHAVIGPPCGGKSTYVDMHRQPGDIVLDFDVLAGALLSGDGVEHHGQQWLRDMATGAWYGAYRRAVRVVEPVGIWLVKAMPMTPRSPRLLDEWISLDYDIVVCDPGKREVLERCKARASGVRGEERAILQWYRLGLTQSSIDARLNERRERLAALGLASKPVETETDEDDWLAGW
ncbi:HNH endonuclease [Bifidobacterium imperatoris]|uniref:HNH endonuclease n=1 Tax=Bifidobacterium imperatoris TaxID=2020965 RepID=A0A2N5IQW4_9BIFI|nr:HNH endonuclease signature motif containing protein [Bifidobacterium imperatoris]PLS24349.1 hypothetical protein Tam1G_1612 [Bifidobacterium imperatoris]QSY56949.1 HNH endonuclease [Bifidobacterium imperatoris]